MKRASKSEADIQNAKFERYLSFKIRFVETIHFAITKTQKLAEHDPSPLVHCSNVHVANTMQTALYTWVGGLNDPDNRGVNVFQLLKEFFPLNIGEIREVERKLREGMKLIQTFRNTHGAHASSFDTLLASDRALKDNKEVIEYAVCYFLQICDETLIKREREIFPDFEARVDAFIKKHDLSPDFRCIAMSTPSIKDIPRRTPPPQIGSIEFNGQKLAVVRFER